jgi:hypothetical protein
MDIVFSAYFDKFGFKAEKNKPDLTAIGRLFLDLSFPNNSEITKKIGAFRTTWNYSYYASGLGTPHKPEQPFKTGAALVLDSIPDAAKKKGVSQGKAMATEAAKSKAPGKWASDVLKKETGLSTQGWRTNWRKYLHHRSVVSGNAAISAKQVATAARLAEKHFQDGIQGAAKLGKTLAKGLAKEVVKAGAMAALESTEAADSNLAARTFRSGYKKRISDAWESLVTVIRSKKAKIRPPGQTCCGEVRVFIFGAEWGGTLARIFANKIVKECKKKDGKLVFEEIPLRICFVGLFDCANSVSAKRSINSILSRSPLTVSLGETALPQEAEAAFHVYGAHERGYLLSSIAGGKAQLQEECALPGISADVCGGRLRKGEYGLAHLDIAKYALCQMHAMAKGFGAPFAAPDDGSLQATNLATALESDFWLNGKDIHEHLPLYLHLTDTATAEAEKAVRSSAEVYTKWLRMLYDNVNEGHDLDRVMAASGNTPTAFIDAMKQQVKCAAPEARRGVQLIDSAREHQAGQVWLSGKHLENPFVPAFLAAYVHFNAPVHPLSFRDVDE